jgi:glycosidase
MESKLEYLKRLGVTSILLTPLYQSDFYHNYFATDFEKIDPEYGSFKEYRDLVQTVHRIGMKIYQDVEMQYVSGKHPWYTDSYKNPSSKYSSYLVYEDKQNQKPYYFLGIPEFTLYDNSKEQIAVVNMKDPKVKEYTLKVLKYWADPNGDGKFYDGVDGFRLDHMMNDLDNAGKLTNLFKDFWTPLLSDLKKVNPDLKIIAEQANWNSYGYDYFTKGNVDGVFAFKLKHAIDSFDKKKIEAAADSTFHFIPKGKEQIVFIENHDTKRFATTAGSDIGKMKVGAALNFLMGGTPLIYYGQEIGMKGEQLKGPTDGNDIPIREAFEWYASDNGPGMALWYKDTGPWWDNRNMKANDGISFEEQLKDKSSLWNFYKEMIAFAKYQPALITGDYASVVNSNDKVLSFLRTSEKDKILVVINLSGEQQDATLDYENAFKIDGFRLILGTADSNFKKGGRTLILKPYAIQAWRLP